MTTSNVERMRELEKAATGVPWRWRNCAGGSPELVSPPGGMLLVMDAVRHGMNGADFRFAKRTDGMGGTMHKAIELLPKAGRGVPDYPEVTNPDMKLIAEMRNCLPALLEIAEAAQELEKDATVDGQLCDQLSIVVNEPKWAAFKDAIAKFNSLKIEGL